ncbi:sel1 repeat family protein [Ideonella dechloratans]|uniref:Sel1 repeat family protein n=2 Tax=Ideonella dechloratans TaxID=36863 RepID=A0A643FFE1_IDEDE|nr:sel1 repeat family protein [Ideonella dechloratans]
MPPIVPERQRACRGRLIVGPELASGEVMFLRSAPRWPWAVPLLCLALCGAAAAQDLAEAPPQVDPALQQALDAYAQGRWAEAARSFEALARQGQPVAQHDLAAMHLRGEVPHASVATALHWLLQAADAGFVTSQQALGELYESGRLGWKDLPQAVAWYHRAAEAGSPQAQLEMGTACFLGRGTPQDLAQAARWYRQAALAGDLGAMYILASMYEKGEGVDANRRLARYWYAAAADAGDEAAPYKVKELTDAEAPSP